MLRSSSLVAAAAALLMASAALAQDWSALPYTAISDYQAVTSTGGSAYTGGFPVRM